MEISLMPAPILPASMHKQGSMRKYYFQKEFSKELTSVAKQVLHLRYGNFQVYQMNCEDKAIFHFIEGAKINQESKEKEKMKNKLEKIAQTRLSRNRADSEALHLLAFLQEVNGETGQADENSERDLDSGSLMPSASLAEEWGTRAWRPQGYC